MKRILYDLRATQALHGVKYHGGGEYSKAVYRRLLEKIDFQKFTLEVFYDGSEWLEDDINSSLKIIVAHDCRSQEEIQSLLESKHYDILFSGLPGVFDGIKVPDETQFIFTIHGLREIEKPFDKYMFKYEKMDLHQMLKKISIYIIPDYWHRKYHCKTQRILDSSINRRILTVSNHSKYSLLVNFPALSESEIYVFNSPTKFAYISENDACSKLSEMKLEVNGYFLMVSAGRWLKNNLRAILAFDDLLTHNQNMMGKSKVVLTGVTNPDYFLKHIHNKERFIFLEYVDTLTLEALYFGAHAFVYPTLNEGFGYPPLEAMKYNTLALCSNVTSIPEVCGDAVLYFNPYDIMEIKNRILQSFDKSILDEKKKKMQTHFRIVDENQKKALDGIADMILED